MTKHTPAPWTLETVKTSAGICHKVGPFPWRGDRQNHACIYVDNHSHDMSAPRDQELLANARLICAAPELLSALQELLTAHSNENIGVDASMRRIKAKEQARAAIAKATGAQP